MNFAHRFTLMVKGSLNALMDQIEDPEQSLHQLILEMEEQLEVAKRAVAQAIANEDHLRSRIAFYEKDAEEWQTSARRALKRGKEDDAREALRRHEQARHQASTLKENLASQEQDTEEVRESVKLLHERLGQAEARKAAGKALRGMERTNVFDEFDRLGDRVDRQAAEERAYLHLDDQLSGTDVRRRFRNDALDEAVEDGLEALRREMEGDDGAGNEDGAQEASTEKNGAES
jgi:phage shock protein A